MAKKNVEEILQLMLDTIRHLSEDQVLKLCTGKATLQYEELSTESDPYEQIREEIDKAEDIKEIEQLFKNHTKKSLISICKYFQIAMKSTDTKAVLTNKIVAHFGKATVKVGEESMEFQEIQQQLEKIETIKEGKTLINNHATLKTKVNLIKLAKTLNVYIDPTNKKKDIQSRIVESIVGARLRGKGIRER
ncbi:hypothetical protein M3175_10995 [Robertmurraya korlensis]|uniref:hypothetical protein n=1 Tax=Robertmurraya korlensis TaxID=519977 RepID=UPI00204170A8|nr:hypothetical protein [Robertmurraya korlensis]MCM3601258.1 hypothetical protein [Robertmurraya korlensis]